MFPDLALLINKWIITLREHQEFSDYTVLEWNKKCLQQAVNLGSEAKMQRIAISHSKCPAHCSVYASFSPEFAFPVYLLIQIPDPRTAGV
jgi:hypothetical protein